MSTTDETQVQHTPGRLTTGFYVPSERFLGIREHRAVMRADGSLVATCGPADDPASAADATLFAAAPDMLEYYTASETYHGGLCLSESEGRAAWERLDRARKAVAAHHLPATAAPESGAHER